MTRLQATYLLQRLTEVLHEKRADLRRKHTTEGKYISDAERAELIRSGKVTLRKEIGEVCTTAEIRRVFDLSAYEWEQRFDEQSFSADYKKLKAEANVVKDAIILGDLPRAWALFKAFEQYKV